MLEEGEHPAAMVRVPVREDDALDSAHVCLHGLDIADKTAQGYIR